MKFVFIAGKSDWVKLRIGWLVFEDNPAIADVNRGCKLAAENPAVSLGVGRLVIPSFSRIAFSSRTANVAIFRGKTARLTLSIVGTQPQRARAAYICRANRRAILGIPR